MRPARSSELEELATFGAALERLRRQCQLSYRELSEKAGYSSSVLAKAASGRERPTLDVVQAFVTACGGDLPDWIKRWHTVNAAVDRYQRELQAMDDTPYEIMTCPSSPGRFNRQLQLRVGRAGKQAGVAVRANYAPSTASGVFNGNRLANEDFVRRMLAAANAPDDEQATWLEWRRQLAREPQWEVSRAASATPVQQPRWHRHTTVARSMIVAIGVTVLAVGYSGDFGSPELNAHLDAVSRSHPVDVPSQIGKTAAPPSPPVDVPRIGGTPRSDRDRPPASTVPALPPPATPDGIRRWKATIGGEQTTVYVVCVTTKMTKSQPAGWYYTDRGEYLDPRVVRFSGDDRYAIPACSRVSFPEIGMASMPNDPKYPRIAGKQHSGKR